MLGLIRISYATEPCVRPDKQWFFDNVIKKSELIVYAKIKDYSGNISNVFKSKWTTIKILQVLHGELNDQKEITIQDWRSYDQPLYVNEKDSYAVFWLSKHNNKYFITDLDWRRCVPSIWHADDQKTAYNLVSNKRVSLEEIKNLIAEAFAN